LQQPAESLFGAEVEWIIQRASMTGHFIDRPGRAC
jgi:hypothetical protein